MITSLKKKTGTSLSPEDILETRADNASTSKSSDVFRNNIPARHDSPIRDRQEIRAAPGSDKKRSREPTPAGSPEATLKNPEAPGSDKKRSRNPTPQGSPPPTGNSIKEMTPATKAAQNLSTMRLGSPGFGVAENPLSYSRNPSSSSYDHSTWDSRLQQSRVPEISSFAIDEEPSFHPKDSSSSSYDYSAWDSRLQQSRVPEISSFATEEDSLSHLRAPSTSSLPLTTFNRAPVLPTRNLRSSTPDIRSLLESIHNPLSLTPSEAESLLNDIDSSLFYFMRQKTETSPLPLNMQDMLITCQLFGRTWTPHHPLGTLASTKSCKSIIRMGLNLMSTDQIELLLNLLSTEAFAINLHYSVLSEICFNKFFLEIDPKGFSDLSTLPPYDTSLRQVIDKANLDIQTESHVTSAQSAANIELCEKVKTLALKLLDRPIPTSYFFHTTNNPLNINTFIANGIPVSHGKTYPGAFTSSEFEPRFGDSGVAVPINRLAAMQKSLHRVERRCIQDGSQVWLGSKTPIPIDQETFIYDSHITRESLAELSAMLTRHSSNFLLIPSDVLTKFLSYLRDYQWYSPTPALCSSKSIKSHSREKEGVEVDALYASTK